VTADGTTVTVASKSSSNFGSVRNIAATTPVAVYLSGTATLAAIAGDETMGKSFVVPSGGTLFARVDTMVNGKLVSAGDVMLFNSATQVTTDAPVAVTVGAMHVPPTAAWRATAYSFDARSCTLFTLPATATATSVSGVVASAQPFMSLCDPTFSLGYGLDVIP